MVLKWQTECGHLTGGSVTQVNVNGMSQSTRVAQTLTRGTVRFCSNTARALPVLRNYCLISMGAGVVADMTLRLSFERQAILYTGTHLCDEVLDVCTCFTNDGRVEGIERQSSCACMHWSSTASACASSSLYAHRSQALGMLKHIVTTVLNRPTCHLNTFD